MTDDRNRPATEGRDMVTAKHTPAPHRDAAKAMPQLLVIDDDATHRMVISRLAQALGYATTDAAAITEAAELIAARRFDCITLDLHMGAQNGSELFDIMSTRQPNVPVIVISSAGDKERWRVLRVATLYGVRVTEVPKPLDVGRLKAVFLELKDMA